MIYTNSRSEVPQGGGGKEKDGEWKFSSTYFIYIYIYIYERDLHTFNMSPSLPKGWRSN